MNAERDFLRKSGRALYRVFIAPRLHDEDAARREYILNVILIGSIVMLILFDGLVGYYDALGHPSGTAFEAFSLLPISFILLYLLSRRGFVALASYLLLVTYFIGNSYAAYHWGVNLPTALLGYALLIVIGSVLIDTRFGFFLAAAVVAYVLPLSYLQMRGIITPTTQQLTLGDTISLVILYVLIVVVAWLSNREIEKSLIRARVSEWALKGERDRLEIKVDERTRELRQAQLEKIENVYRLAAFGDLASGLFHNLINMLMSLMPTGERDQDVIALSKNITSFAEGMRRQLTYGNVEQSFSLNDAIGYAISLLDYKAHLATVAIIFEKKKDVEYYGNQFQFHNVIVNLIGNAIESYRDVADRNAKNPRTVRVTVSAADGWITIAVGGRCGKSEKELMIREMEALIIAQTLYYFLASLVIVVLGVLVTIIAYHLIYITKHLRHISDNLDDTSDELKVRVEEVIERLSSLPILSYFLRRDRSHTFHNKGRST